MARKHKVFNEEQVKDLLENADRIVFVEKDNRMINGKIADDRVLPLKEELYRRYERFQDDRDEAIVPLICMFRVIENYMMSRQTCRHGSTDQSRQRHRMERSPRLQQ